MIRLLVICIIFLLAYLGFTALSQLDTAISFNLYNFYIETTFFTFVSIFILSVLFLFIAFKIIFLFLDLPSNLKHFFYSRQLINSNYLLIQAMIEYIMRKSTRSIPEIKKISPYLKPENIEPYNLFMAESEGDPEKKIQLFQKLEKSKNYSAFVTKRLARLYYQKNMYSIAEGYAVKSYNLDETDGETVEILIDCYAKLFSWTKLAFLIAKLHRLDKEKYYSIKDKLADYCVQAAKYMLSSNEDDAIHNAELAIQLVPSHYDALTLYFSLNKAKNSKNIEILKNAFIDQPSFEIAQLYKQFSLLPPAKIYQDLTNFINPKEYLGLFLSIAAYYDLPDKIAELNNTPKLLAFHQS